MGGWTRGGCFSALEKNSLLVFLFTSFFWENNPLPRLNYDPSTTHTPCSSITLFKRSHSPSLCLPFFPIPHRKKSLTTIEIFQVDVKEQGNMFLLRRRLYCPHRGRSRLFPPLKVRFLEIRGNASERESDCPCFGHWKKLSGEEAVVTLSSSSSGLPPLLSKFNAALRGREGFGNTAETLRPTTTECEEQGIR